MKSIVPPRNATWPIKFKAWIIRNLVWNFFSFPGKFYYEINLIQIDNIGSISASENIIFHPCISHCNIMSKVHFRMIHLKSHYFRHFLLLKLTSLQSTFSSKLKKSFCERNFSNCWLSMNRFLFFPTFSVSVANRRNGRLRTPHGIILENKSWKNIFSNFYRWMKQRGWNQFFRIFKYETAYLKLYIFKNRRY